MALDIDEVRELKSFYPDVEGTEEAGVTFIRIPVLTLPAGCSPQKSEALLCPVPRDNYPSRLFLAQRVSHSGPGNNWNADGVLLAGKKWWAVSWHTHQTGQRLLGMITAHLLAFTCKRT